jgi:hypothetical protein
VVTVTLTDEQGLASASDKVMSVTSIGTDKGVFSTDTPMFAVLFRKLSNTLFSFSAVTTKVVSVVA